MHNEESRQLQNWTTKCETDFVDIIIFSDKAHYHIDSFINKHHCLIWNLENLRIIDEKKKHPKRVTLW